MVVFKSHYRIGFLKMLFHKIADARGDLFAGRLIAMPFKSLPELAAVAEVLGTFAVSVAVILICCRSTPNSKRHLGQF